MVIGSLRRRFDCCWRMQASQPNIPSRDRSDDTGRKAGNHIPAAGQHDLVNLGKVVLVHEPVEQGASPLRAPNITCGKQCDGR
jgi:hypothetical protein